MNRRSNEYIALHHWLRVQYGNADKCESQTCSGKSKKFEYALIHGKEYEAKRENFWQLCCSCHKKYDYPGGNKTAFKKGMVPWHKGKKVPYVPRGTKGRKAPWVKGGFTKGYTPWNKGTASKTPRWKDPKRQAYMKKWRLEHSLGKKA